MKANSPAVTSESEAMPLLWLGVATAFRLFAYGLLIGASSLDSRGFLPLANAILQGVYGLVAISSPCWVPFSAGFVSAYFWPNPETEAYTRANGLSTWLFFAICTVVVLTEGLAFFVCTAPFLIFLDASIIVRGGDLGHKFWNSRQGRQFLGDFSTDGWLADDGETLS